MENKEIREQIFNFNSKNHIDYEDSLNIFYKEIDEMNETNNIIVIHRIYANKKGMDYIKSKNIHEKYSKFQKIIPNLVPTRDIEGDLEFNIQIILVSNYNSISTIYNSSHLVGYEVFGDTDRLYLCGITSDKETSIEQLNDIFAEIENILLIRGYSFKNIVRKWVYLDEIYDLYSKFNKIRMKYFEKNDSEYFEKFSFPASTVIGMGSLSNRVVTLDLIAVRNTSLIEYINSTGVQNSPSEYGITFSRATKSNTSDKKLYISGTASINNAGQSVHLNDIEGQIRKTNEAIKSILNTQSQYIVISTIVYCKNNDVMKFYRNLNNIDFPHRLEIVADVCREELLFEVEVVADLM